MKTPLLGSKFIEALGFASEVHVDQCRKSTEIPYVAHLMSVCALVLENGGDEEEGIAALLHDALEDQPKRVDKAEIVKRFGPRVAMLVEQASDTPSDYAGGPKPPWRARKEAYIERIRHEGYPMCRIALADKLHNLRSIAEDHRQIGDKVWSRFNAGREDQLWQYRALVGAFRDAGAPTHLVNELASLVNELE